jgi:hypothetical protein
MAEARSLTTDSYKYRNAAWYPVEANGGFWLTCNSNREGPNYQIWAVDPQRPKTWH